MTPEPAARWDALRPASGDWLNQVGKSRERDEVIRQFRALADFLESNPQIPVAPSYTRIGYTMFAAGTDQEKRAQVDYAAALLAEPVTDDLAAGGHYMTEKSFGGVEYRFVAIMKEPVERTPQSFVPGQEVRIAPEVASGFRRSGIAQVGVVESGQDGLYLIRVPGDLKLQLPGRMLDASDPSTVSTSRGPVTSLADIEDELVAAAARTRLAESQGQAAGPADSSDARELGYALARRCGLPRDTLLRQLDRLIASQFARLEQATRRENALRPAGQDRVPNGRNVPVPPSRSRTTEDRPAASRRR